MNPLEVGSFRVEISLCASQLSALANNKEVSERRKEKQGVGRRGGEEGMILMFFVSFLCS